MRIWALAGVALWAGLLVSGCAPGESTVASPDGPDRPAPVEPAPRATAEGDATSSGDAAKARAAADRAAKSDARSIAVMMETYYTDVMAYPTALVERRSAKGTRIEFPDGDSVFDSVKLTPGTSASVRSDGQSFCISMTNPAATRPWIYESYNGGLQMAPDAVCDTEDGVAILGS